jgi:AcrR family transcriptional regulator
MGSLMAAEVKRRLSYADRRQQLLSVARAMIRADGLSGLTMAGLAARANIAKPVVYTHFENSRDVVIALLEDHFAAIAALFEKRVSAARTLDSYLEAVVEAAFAFDSVSETPIRKITNGFSAGDAVNRVFLAQETIFREHWRHLLVLLGVPWDATDRAAVVLAAMVMSVRVDPGSEHRDREILVCMLAASIAGLCTRSGGDLASLAFDQPIYELISLAQTKALGVPPIS